MLLLNIILFSLPVKAGSSISMSNGIGIHEFDLADSGDLISDGFIEITNRLNKSAIIVLSTSNNIFSVDLGPNNKPRTHILGFEGDKANVTFEALPDISWIKIENTEYTLKPYEKILIDYKVVFSRSELVQYNVSTSRGFLGYIYIKSTGGSQINVNYRYKMFIIFEETINTVLIVPAWIQHIIIVGLIVTIASIIIVKKVELVEVK